LSEKKKLGYKKKRKKREKENYKKKRSSCRDKQRLTKQTGHEKEMQG